VKPARLRVKAKVDLAELGLYYAEVGGPDLGQRAIDDALRALGVLGQQPGIGSQKWALKGEQPPLRAWRLRQFPAVWLYFERADHLDMVRLLGERQDIGRILADDPA
jgi:toxin ParE1/3/4